MSNNRKKRTKGSKSNRVSAKKKPEVMNDNKSEEGVLRKTKKGIIFLYSLLGVLVTFITVYFFIPQIRDEFKTQKQKWEEKKFLRGIFIPPDIIRNDAPIKLIFGGEGGMTYSWPASWFSPDTKYKGNIIGCNDKPAFDIKFKILNNRLFIETTLTDINKNEVIAIINYDEWLIPNDNLINYTETDKSLEIIDKSNNVALSIQYLDSNTILISGYYVDRDSIFVASESGFGCFTSNQKNEALKFISTIKRISGLNR